MVMKLSELYLYGRKVLSQTEDLQTAGMLARNLLCHATEKTYQQLLADMDHYGSESVCQNYFELVKRVAEGEPIAYVLGEWDFFGMTLQVTKDVLIPRDDTCAVTELAIKQALFLEKSPRILDLCTGSGCIGLAIARRITDARVTLADVSKEALAIAKQNAVRLKLSGRVSCVTANALAAPNAFLGKFDMIVSNPPYITTAEMKQLPDSVKNYEPHLALHGGLDGLDFYRSIAANYAVALKPGGLLCFEFGINQGDDVCQILESNGYSILERVCDYQKVERAVIARLERKDVNNGN